MRVCFRHEAPPDLSLHHEIFGCELHFGCKNNGFLFDAVHLDGPIGGSLVKFKSIFDIYVRAQIRSLTTRDITVKAAVSSAISNMAGTELCTAERIAELLGMAKAQSPVDALKDPLSYYCENGKTVVASYSTGKSGKSTVQLGIDGKVYLLTEEESGSGAKYASDHGPRAGYRMVWWTKDDAMWLEAPMGKGADQELLIANCTLRPPAHS